MCFLLRDRKTKPRSFSKDDIGSFCSSRDGTRVFPEEAGRITHGALCVVEVYPLLALFFRRQDLVWEDGKDGPVCRMFFIAINGVILQLSFALLMEIGTQAF